MRTLGLMLLLFVVSSNAIAEWVRGRKDTGVILPSDDFKTFLTYAGLTAPIWLPILRFVFSLIRNSRSNAREFIWCYVFSFVWAIGSLAIYVLIYPSYLYLILVYPVALLVMMVAMAVDPLFRREIQ